MPAAWPAPTLDRKPPIVIAHRGASGYRPDHTLEGYALAIDMGADVIEPDLVFTKDGVLVVRHDRYLSTTTDVADHPEFADRRRIDVYDASAEGVSRNDWWVEDFTLAEIKTLRARQPREPRSKDYDGLYEIPTFAEVLALVTEKAKEAGRPVGAYPETKHPKFFASIGHDFEEPLLAALKGFDAGPVCIQSFEPEILKRLKGKTNAKLVQLVFEETPGAGSNIPLTEIAAYANGVGPAKELILGPDGAETSFVNDAHALGLMVHPWTFRADQPNQNMKGPFVTRGKIELRGSKDGSSSKSRNGAEVEGDDRAEGWAPETLGDGLIYAEFSLFFGIGVDGVFTDFPDTAVAVRAALSAPQAKN